MTYDLYLAIVNKQIALNQNDSHVLERYFEKKAKIFDKMGFKNTIITRLQYCDAKLLS